MEIDPTISNLLRAFASRAGMQGFELNAEGRAALRFDDKLCITFQQRGESSDLVMIGDLGEIPQERHAGVLEAMLHGNYFWQKTRGATLALQGEPAKAVLLLEIESARISDEDFRLRLDQFVDACEAWSEFIAGTGEFGVSPQSESAQDHQPPGWERNSELLRA